MLTQLATLMIVLWWRRLWVVPENKNRYLQMLCPLPLVTYCAAAAPTPGCIIPRHREDQHQHNQQEVGKINILDEKIVLWLVEEH